MLLCMLTAHAPSAEARAAVSLGSINKASLSLYIYTTHFSSDSKLGKIALISV